MDESTQLRTATRDRLMRQFDAAADKRAFMLALPQALLPLCDLASLRSFVEAQRAMSRRT